MNHIPEDVLQAAWRISATHLTKGEKNVNTMIADAILAERRRCAQLADDLAARNPDLAQAIRTGLDIPPTPTD